MLNRPIAVEPQANWKLAFGCATGENRDLHHPSCDSRDIGSLQGDFSILIWDVGLRLLPDCIQNLVSSFPNRRPQAGITSGCFFIGSFLNGRLWLAWTWRGTGTYSG
jgi:hypothetical protein